MHTAFTASTSTSASTRTSAALPPAAAFRTRLANEAMRTSLAARPTASNDEDDFGLNGWLASSVELRRGLVVQYLRIDPLDADWRDVFAA